MRRNGSARGAGRGGLSQARRWWCAAAILCAAAAAACDGDGDGNAGGGGPGGSGGSGGAAGGCLDASAHAELLSITDPDLCAVALYTADVTPSTATWGRHGGPLLVAATADGGAEILRLTPPAGSTGALMSEATPIDVGVPDGAFLGGQALDLPFHDWTALSWTGAFPDTQGELILASSGSIAHRYPINGFYGGAGLAAAPDGGRLLYTGLSLLGEMAAGANALYAADTCSPASGDPGLLPEGDPSCPPPIQVAAWGDFSGPVAVDRDGNAFAILPGFAGEQEARAFPAAAVARGAGPTEGAPLFTLPGFGSSLAAIPPDGASPGLLFFQPYDPSTFEALDPIVARYTAEASVEAEGAPTPALQLATPGTGITLAADDADRIWVSLPSADGGTTFVVLARK